MSGVETFLDDSPGEVRGMVVRNGRFERLIIQRESDAPQRRLGARSVGRIAAVDAGLKGAFVDVGAPEPFGFLPLRKSDRVAVGAKVEVEVSAEPREHKGPTLRLIGAGEGEARLLNPGPTVTETLARLAPGVEPRTGAAAIRAALEAEEEALAPGALFAHLGVRLAVERTRALVAVDIDYAATPGREGRRDKGRANRDALTQVARLIRLKGWGGLVAVDLVGSGHDGAAMLAAARAAFAEEPEAVFGPINRFGVLMLSLPWRTTPAEERLIGPGGRATAEARAIDAVRRLALALAENTAAPHLTVRCPPAIAAAAGALATRLGPRARVKADPALSGGVEIDEG
ncbi:ribonuclease E/G [Roseibacterium beibuensis]|uniref:ribonuclease E/G n=1 Tax=[Roseibacterium] beibuensis TaxID=1193142 RepID=UPI00217E2922|nr:ribonuclease E/G [Roseibacterium beibuensis]MCS6627009.1 ribonuclease E/G [Roseibacterium beibuensis]